MDFKDYIQGKRETLPIPLPPVLTIMLLQRRLREYGFEVSIEFISKLKFKDVCRLFIFMNTVNPEDVNFKAMLDKLTLATIMGGSPSMVIEE
ncbi:MAG: hypothetical protein QXX57_05430, partial [Nitrososphaerota archaeon]